MQSIIYVDLRCLQDVGYRLRGIGYHTSALLRARQHSALSDWKAIGLIEPNLPELPPAFAALVDETTSSLNPSCNGARHLFLDASPMTHDTRFSLRFLNHPAFLRAGVLYDFIPLDWPGYLCNPSDRIEYLAKIARLRKFHQLFPISEYTAWRASELAEVSRARMHVTGACVRDSLYADSVRRGVVSSSHDRNEPYFVTLGGDDRRRKNTETAVKAVRYLNLLYGRRIPLKVIGFYSDGYKSELLRLAGHSEGAGFLEFHPHISDEELVSLHADAIAAIAPSYIEGFSLPVVEASVSACPVIASVCAAHMELIDQPEALFPPDDAAALCGRLEAVMNDPTLRASLLASQSHLRERFHEEAVAKRFWSAIEIAVEHHSGAPAITKHKKPLIAFLSPYPPDPAGPALYSANTLRAGRTLFDADLYTDAPRPLTAEITYRDAGRVTLAPVVTDRYDSIVSVLGNSRFHKRIFEFFERYGGPCILHDARLTDFHYRRMGPQAFRNFAARLLGRRVSVEEVDNWLDDRDLPTLFLEPAIRRASPLIVHTTTQQAEIKKRYGIEAHVLPCCSPNVAFAEAELTLERKEAVRQQLGIPLNVFLISSFGYVHTVKAFETCILAIELMRSWNIPAELYFVGNAGNFQQEADRLANTYGIAKYIHTEGDFVNEATFRDFLIASDAGLQLRTYGFGQFSGGLSDCIIAALPCVANNDLAISCDAPDYVRTVPDRFSPLQVAEQLATIWDSQTQRRSHEEMRAAYVETHNFEYYGKRLIEVLGIG